MCVRVCACVHTKLLQSCPTLCDPMDYTPPGSSVHGILQARLLECLPPGDLPNLGTEPRALKSPALTGGFFTTSSTWEAPLLKGKCFKSTSEILKWAGASSLQVTQLLVRVHAFSIYLFMDQIQKREYGSGDMN